MIIDCSNCNKKFEIDHNLIPKEGRLLQCGNCNHQWFYKLDEINQTNEIELEKYDNDKIENSNEIKKNNSEYEDTKLSNKDSQKEININYFKYFLVAIISFISIIIILETFKESLETIFPNIKLLLDNLYQSIHDLKLFIVDLTK